MGRKREVDRAAESYERVGEARLAVARLLLGIAFLAAWTFVFGPVAEEIASTSRAARGEGRPGTFTAQVVVCAKRDCSWHGTFSDGSTFRMTHEKVELRGADSDYRSIDAGDMVPALDVGSRNFVHRQGAPPEWGLSVGPGAITAVLGTFGVAAVASALLAVSRTRPSRAARRRAAVERGRFALRDLADRDRWGWSARPRSSVIKVKAARSKALTAAATACLVSLLSAVPLFGVIWIAVQDETTVGELIAGSWLPLFALALAAVTVQTLRLVLVRPRMWVTDDEIVIWDGLLLWKALRVPRTGIAAVGHGDAPGRPLKETDVARLTPFQEDLNLVLVMRDALSLPARRLRWGNWFWVMLSMSRGDPQPYIPQRGRRVGKVRLRVKEPRRVAAELDRWLAKDEPVPAPEPAPVDHSHHGRARRYRGVGGKRVKIRGRMPEPVLAEFVNEGPGTLRAWLRRTEFGRGTAVVVCDPGAPPATVVLDDRRIADQALTKRYLQVESEGPWAVTISGPEGARGFTGAATGHGPEVLAYDGPAGIAVLTCPGGHHHEVRMHGPNLTALHGCDPLVSAGALDPTGQGASPSRSTFAVPAQAVLQVRTAGADWRIDVTPLDEADVDAVPALATGRVRPFEHSIAGYRAAVVRYLGPPGPVLFRSGEAFGLLELDRALTPFRTLACPGGDQVIELRSRTLLQVTGGRGAWSLEEAPPQPPASAGERRKAIVDTRARSAASRSCRT